MCMAVAHAGATLLLLQVLDSLLDGVLPGASLSSLSRSYMDDIFAGADEDEELLDLEEELLE